MLSAIKSFFEEHVLAVEKQDPEHGIKLASTALLVEMMRMDDELHDNEHKILLKVLSDKFALSKTEVNELFNLANKELTNSTDYYQFTSLINQHFDYQERVHMVELLWQVAYADNSLDRDEEYLVRKVSELIYVSHEDFIATKLRVRNSQK